jgi:hypothetical protein
VDAYEEGWNEHYNVANDEFEVFLKGDPNLSKFSRHMFHVWDGNHRLQAWMPYITWVHPNDANWYICVDFILLDTTRGLVELLMAMTDLNR